MNYSYNFKNFKNKQPNVTMLKQEELKKHIISLSFLNEETDRNVGLRPEAQTP